MVLWAAYGMVYTRGDGRGAGRKKEVPPLHRPQNGWPPEEPWLHSQEMASLQT